jgi:CheY-like chemotaxis protein
LGIGLTLVKSLVELHSGRVEAYSAGPGRGSEFRVSLPVAPEGRESHEPERHEPEQGPPERPAAARLLVVDDNRESANSLGLLMKLAGHEVRVAYDGPAALEVARAFQPQVVLLDLEMPGMSGDEVARHLRAQSSTKHVLIVALTGYGSEEDRRHCLEAGFDQLLVKPVDLCTLQKMLGSLVALA